MNWCELCGVPFTEEPEDSLHPECPSCYAMQPYEPIQTDLVDALRGAIEAARIRRQRKDRVE